MMPLPGALLVWCGIVSGAWAGRGHQQALYSPPEWESITVTRFVSRIVPGTRYTAAATSGGLLLYDRLRERWRFPFTTADGLPDGPIEGLGIATDGTIAVTTSEGGIRLEPGTGYLRSDRFPVVEPPPTVPLPANLFSDPAYHYLGDGRIEGPLTVTAPARVSVAWPRESVPAETVVRPL